LAGKGFLIVAIAVYSMLMVLIFSLIFGFIFTKDLTGAEFVSKTYILLVYFVQAVAYMATGFLLVVLFRNTALAIVLFILYRLIIEPVFRLFFPQEVRLYFPMKVISNLTPMPEFLSIASGNDQDPGNVDSLNLREMGLMVDDLPVYLNLLLAVGYTSLFIYLAWLLLRRRNM
jgi:ABC-type transport system involved in multi-copper enzyme maturation permease subunit